jgi:hypothetical protein
MAESLPMSGHIDPKSFPFLLVDLHRQGATGSLKVEGASHQKALYLRAGRVLFGSSNDPRDQLGAILIESGKITEEQLDDVNKKVGPGNPLAKALADSGIVSQRELSDAARAKVERILSDVLSYTSGSYEFEDGVLPKGAVDLKLSPERLFLAAVRRVGDRGFVLRHLDGLDVVVSLKSELGDKLPEIEGELLGLNQHLDGLATLKDAASRAALDEFEAAKVACGLLFLGLAERNVAPVTVDAGDASPFFVPADAGTELNFGGTSAGQAAGSSLAISVDDAPKSSEPEKPADVDSTMMLGSLPNFSLPSMPSPPAPAADPPAKPTPAGNNTAPLKIIPPPPRPAAERTRPPSKPSKEDLAALDELLGKRSPEGPLTPLQKPTEEWKPSFLPPQPARGGRKQKTGGGRNTVLFGLIGALVVAAGAGAWVAWENRAPQPVNVAANPRPSPSAPASAAATIPSATPSAAASVAPATPSPATTPPLSTAKPSPPPSSPPSPVTASTTPSAKPTAPPTTQPKAGSGKPATLSLAESGSLLRRGQFDEAARGFQTHLKDAKATHSVQVLLACSTETMEKVVKSVQAEDLFIVPINYRGKSCYRVGWGLYDSEAKAKAGMRAVPAYFTAENNRPKVVTLAEMLR